LREGRLVWSFAYLAVRNVFALVVLGGRPRRSKELEILVLRHEVGVLREGSQNGVRRVNAQRLLRPHW
jgi:hypothetical protein